MAPCRIVLLPGDGIGPEVIAAAARVLRALEAAGGPALELVEHPAGAGEYLRSGAALPPATFAACRRADAVLLGAMGLPDVRLPDGRELTPQLDLRERLDLYAGPRPLRLYHGADTPLKGVAAGEIDLVIVRENTEGLFSGRGGAVAPDAAEAADCLRVTRRGCDRVIRFAFDLARRRRRRCALVDKANVLPSMVFMRRIFDEVAREYPDVESERVYVDAAALHLVRRPQAFDVIVTENMFGDILSDLGAALVGGMGMAPSGDVGDRHGVFQPSHGSAPDIAGRGIANPTAAVLSAAMMLDWLGREDTRAAARRIEAAVARLFADPTRRTPDMGGSLTTAELTDRLVALL